MAFQRIKSWRRLMKARRSSFDPLASSPGRRAVQGTSTPKRTAAWTPTRATQATRWVTARSSDGPRRRAGCGGVTGMLAGVRLHLPGSAGQSQAMSSLSKPRKMSCGK